MLILCKAWAPRRRLCDVQNGEGVLCFPTSRLVSILVLEKQGVFSLKKKKKVVLILAVFLKEREMCGSWFLPPTPPDMNTATSDSLQLWLSRGLQSGVNGSHMLSLLPLFRRSRHSLHRVLLVCVNEEENRAQCLFHLTWRNFKFFAAISEILCPAWKLSDSKEESPSHMVVFLCFDPPLHVHTHAHRALPRHTPDDLRGQHSLFKHLLKSLIPFPPRM